jgi:[ribosomal protein S5]-alanine N-acetyltransferase
MLSDIALQSPRLSLLPLSDGDAPALFAQGSDERVMRYGSSLPWETIAQATAKIQRHRLGVAAGESICLVIRSRSDQRFLGTVDLFQIDSQSRRAELGYSLVFEAWGQGYMTEALTVVLDHAFEQLGLNRIEADVDPRNAPSIACLERLGFQREGLLRERWILGGEVSDSVFYGLLRADWRGRSPAG